MLSLSPNSVTVPQVFFHEKHIGGATETAALLQQWDEEEGNDVAEQEADDAANGENIAILTYGAKKRFDREVSQLPESTDSRLDVPVSIFNSELAEPVLSDDDEIPLPLGEGDGLSVLEITSRLEKAIRQTEATTKVHRRGCKYRNITPLTKLIAIVRTEFGKNATTTDATERVDNRWEEFIALLQNRQILHPILTVHSQRYLRMQSHHTPHILNSFRIWNANTTAADDAVDPIALTKRLSHLLNTITSRNTSPATGDVSLSRTRTDDEYNSFRSALCQLQTIDLIQMNDPSTKIAFLINVYNLMIRVAQIELGIPKSNFTRAHYFTAVHIDIGGDLYSFNDLENGVLRGNTPAPFTLSKPFGSKDGRLGAKLDAGDVDHRIHFALNCGAASCPPVKEFTKEGLEEELRVVAMAFTGDDANVRLEKDSGGTVRLSMILNWYRKDFSSSDKGLLSDLKGFMAIGGEKRKILEDMMKGGKAVIKFLPYDWTSHGVSDEIDFDRSYLEADHFSIKALFCI